MKYIIITCAVVILTFGCKVNDNSLHEDIDMVFNIEDLNQNIEDSLGFSILTYVDRINLTSSYMLDSVIGKAKNGEIDDVFIHDLYKTDFHHLSIIEDSSWSRIRITEIVLEAILNSVKDIEEFDSLKMKTMKQKLGKLTFEDYISINRFADSNFSGDIVFISEEVGLSRREVLNLLFLEYFLVETYKCTWCNDI